MTGPTREDVEEWAKRAKLPKHMRDTDSAIDALVRFSACAAGARSSSTADAELVRAASEPTKLPQAVLDFDDFLNEPPSDEGERRVREYRHEAYRKWRPVLDAIASMSGARSGEDSERLQWMQFHGARVSWGNDDEMCCVVWSDRDGEQYKTSLHSDWRTAIDEARGMQT